MKGLLIAMLEFGVRSGDSLGDIFYRLMYNQPVKMIIYK